MSELLLANRGLAGFEWHWHSQHSCRNQRAIRRQHSLPCDIARLYGGVLVAVRKREVYVGGHPCAEHAELGRLGSRCAREFSLEVIQDIRARVCGEHAQVTARFWKLH